MEIKSNQPHFKVLDGMRGIAAIAVVIYHFMEFVIPDYKDNFIAHGHLAVDFFFCLSGFVIAYAYDNRMKKIGIIDFLKLRFIRLHPLVCFGAVIGLLLFIFDPFSPLQAQYGTTKTILMFFSSLFLIPYPVVTERYFNIFHLNPPTWSLFWEYIAYALYAVFLFKLKNKILWCLLFIAAVLLCIQSYHSKFLGVGWGGDNFWGGGARVFYSFIAGMLLFRMGWKIKSGLGFIAMSILLFISFLIPFSDNTNFFVDPLIVILYYPFLVLLGASAGLKKSATKICDFLGNISYPLYVIHYPILWVYLSYIERKKPAMAEMTTTVVVDTIVLIFLAWLVFKFFDAPVRKWLKGKLNRY